MEEAWTDIPGTVGLRPASTSGQVRSLPGGPGKRLLFLDFETRSAVDIAKCGSFRYIDDPTFDVLLLAYAWGDEPVRLVDFARGETWPEDFLQGLRDPNVTCVAHNCAFERAVIGKLLEYTPPEHWFDTMHLVAQCGLPLSLDGAGKALGLPEDSAKMKEGKALIRYFCVPCKPTKTNGGRPWNLPKHAPEKWATFRDYCQRDVEAERTMFKILKRWMPDEAERRFWCLDARINENGVRIDRQLAVNAAAMDRRYKEELTGRAVEITGLENPKSVSQIKKWLLDQEGKQFPSLNKKVIGDVVSQLQTEEAREFMAIRSELSKSSTAKYEAMLRSMSADDHCKGCFVFYGASRTGRFAGRLVQFQNVTKNEMPDLTECRELVRWGEYTTLKALYGGVSGPLSELVRTAVIPEEGCKILVADFSAIEARVTAWFAGEDWRLNVFKRGGDIYCASASQMFKVPVVKHGVNGHLRQKGKVAELALGYGGGINALKTFGADEMGMSEDEMRETVDLWRKSSPRICNLWRALEKAAIRSIRRRGPAVSSVGNVRFDYESGILWMSLPSGRRIAYYGARYEESRWRSGRKALSYMGVDQKSKNKKYGRVETWGGKLTENCWAGDTPVLTRRGWVPIKDVSQSDLLWDGLGWVPHNGVACNGVRPTILLDGLRVTANHKILTTGGWVNAEACNGLDRVRVQLPEGPWEERREGLTRADKMACTMRLRKHTRNRHSGPAQKGTGGAAHILRMYAGPLHLGEKNQARNEPSPGVCGMEVDDRKMHKSAASGLEELRRAWHHCLRKVAGQLRGLLDRYGAVLSAWAGSGSGGQRSRVLPGKLPLGTKVYQLPKQTRSKNRRDQWPTDVPERDFRGDPHQLHHTSLPAGPRLSARAPAGRSRREEPVYDILNAGPRHQYVVLGETGPIIAHNCVQATARDCLRESMLALDEAGYDIRAHVHDEVIVSEPIGGRRVEEMAEIMGRPIDWAPGLPLRADGYETPFYKKD